MNPQTFTFRPDAFEAIQFDGENVADILAFAGKQRFVSLIDSVLILRIGGGHVTNIQPGWWVRRLDGEITVSSDSGDWIAA